MQKAQALEAARKAEEAKRRQAAGQAQAAIQKLNGALIEFNSGGKNVYIRKDGWITRHAKGKGENTEDIRRLLKVTVVGPMTVELDYDDSFAWSNWYVTKGGQWGSGWLGGSKRNDPKYTNNSLKRRRFKITPLANGNFELDTLNGWNLFFDGQWMAAAPRGQKKNTNAKNRQFSFSVVTKTQRTGSGRQMKAAGQAQAAIQKLNGALIEFNSGGKNVYIRKDGWITRHAKGKGENTEDIRRLLKVTVVGPMTVELDYDDSFAWSNWYVTKGGQWGSGWLGGSKRNDPKYTNNSLKRRRFKITPLANGNFELDTLNGWNLFFDGQWMAAAPRGQKKNTNAKNRQFSFSVVTKRTKKSWSTTTTTHHW